MSAIQNFYHKNIKWMPFLITLALSLLTIGLCALTGHFHADLESVPCRSMFWAIVSYVYVIVHTVLCIFLRIKKQAVWLRGIFFYQMIGLLAFIFHFLLLMAGEETMLYTASTYFFSWWTQIFHEGALLLIRLLHFPVRYILMLMLGMVTYITGKSLTGIKIDDAFHKKVQEQKEAEARAVLEAQKHRIQSAKELDQER